jgi:cation diffusion facilitator CzcD-associated flavoprotein CzcO
MGSGSAELGRHVDVLIVGAGLSGIGAAYHLRTRCPGKTFAILEARESLGGTWDLFRYPGIRSDSDMYTLGYSFRPWTNPKAIADGPSILSYIRETAETHGIDREIRYRHRVVRASWSSETARWTVDAVEGASGETVRLTCGFLLMCSGYYDYDQGYTPELPGRERFRGSIVHPQKWSGDVDYEGKRVVVIGSGATAVTLVPALAKRAAHVTMLQRSPTYILSVPERDFIADFLREHLPGELAYAITRWKNVVLTMALYEWCRRYPKHAKGVLVRQVEKLLGGAMDIEPHFTPTYAPWDQRLCLVPDADLFEAIRGGNVSVVTDHIDTFTERAIRLQSGEELAADLIVTATGLRLKLLGGLALDVDGRRVLPADTMVYKGTMLSDVPNLAMVVGYTNASWTLKADLSCEYVCRVLRHMDEHGHAVCCPHPTDGVVADRPVLDLMSGYVKRALHELPRQGAKSPWRLYQNYALDRLVLRYSPLADGTLTFGQRSARPSQKPVSMMSRSARA